MSIDAIRWAWAQKTGKATTKLILLSMADRCSEDHECYPSVKRLSDDTELDRKTILKGLADLEKTGLISDTGERKGATKSVKVFRLNGVVCRHSDDVSSPENGTANNESNPKSGTAKQSQNRDSLPENSSPKNGTASQEAVPFFPPSSTVFPVKLSQKRDTEPLKEPLKEPIKEKSKKKEK